MTPGRGRSDTLQLALGLSPLLARLLAARGWSEVEAVTEFLYPRLEHTHSPWLMLGMERAAARTLAAIAASEPILILGDYDADGTLATVILRQALRSLGADVRYHLPERLRAGYGLQPETIERAAGDGIKLAITVDNGIREHSALARAQVLGLDVIVTDHHLPGETLPPALAILNPHQPGCPYPDKSLCGAGVAFKLAHALLERGGKLDGAWPPALRSYLKLVAIATVADSVPLLGENRVFTRFGLEGLQQPVNAGLRALLGSALPPGYTRVTSRDVAFGLAPRLNAAGRMGAADRVVELFSAPAAAATALAQALALVNQQRQQCCARILAEIDARASAPGSGVELLAGAGWHRGVLGIVAGKVLERTRRPVVIVSLEEGFAHGSGRAPEGVHLLQLLEGCRQLFDRFGGHAQAVGFSMPAAHLPALQAYLQTADVPAASAPAPGWFDLDLNELTPLACQDLARLEPYGEANPEPIFRARCVRLAAPPQVLKERHLKLVVEQSGVRHTALFWNLWRDGVFQSAPRRPELAALIPGTALEISFRLENTVHERFGERTQLILRDFYLSAAAAAG